jgi:hypothetical protein
MVEVFKTNVNDMSHADMLIGMIQQTFPHLKANFDLHDCDNILRVKSATGFIEPMSLINMLNRFGFTAEVLPDEVNVATS